MPTAAPRPCTAIGCGVLVRDGSGRCDSHPRKAWASARNAPKRRTGRWLQQQRHALFTREPMCRICASEGRLKLASIRDHIQSLAEGGEDVDANIQPICAACDATKTANESARGIRRAGPAADRASARFDATRPRPGAVTAGGVEIAGLDDPETEPVPKFLRARVSGGGGG